MGRTTKEPKANVTLALEVSFLQQIDAYAARQNSSRSQVVRDLTELGWKQIQHNEQAAAVSTPTQVEVIDLTTHEERA